MSAVTPEVINVDEPAIVASGQYVWPHITDPASLVPLLDCLGYSPAQIEQTRIITTWPQDETSVPELGQREYDILLPPGELDYWFVGIHDNVSKHSDIPFNHLVHAMFRPVAAEFIASQVITQSPLVRPPVELMGFQRTRLESISGAVGSLASGLGFGVLLAGISEKQAIALGLWSVGGSGYAVSFISSLKRKMKFKKAVNYVATTNRYVCENRPDALVAIQRAVLPNYNLDALGEDN